MCKRPCDSQRSALGSQSSHSARRGRKPLLDERLTVLYFVLLELLISEKAISSLNKCVSFPSNDIEILPLWE